MLINVTDEKRFRFFRFFYSFYKKPLLDPIILSFSCPIPVPDLKIYLLIPSLAPD